MEPLYEEYLEDAQWVGHVISTDRKKYDRIEKQQGIIKYEKSGYYLIREKDTLSFIRCGLFKTNGSTDQLHLDVWYKGKNVLMDGGSYMYNTDEATVRYFSGTESHNTIMLGDYDQMQKGMRFIWLYPPTLRNACLDEEKDTYVFKGCVNAFKHIREGISVQRVVEKKKGTAEWAITDTIAGVPSNIIKRQLWHTDSEVEFSSDGMRIEGEGWTSDYYGVKRPVSQIEFQTNGIKIITTIKI